MDRLSRSMIAALVVLACTTAAGARTEKAVAVEVSAMEHVRELSSEMAAALRSVAGVTGVWEADRESWDVAGAATGPALV